MDYTTASNLVSYRATTDKAFICNAVTRLVVLTRLASTTVVNLVSNGFEFNYDGHRILFKRNGQFVANKEQPIKLPFEKRECIDDTLAKLYHSYFLAK